MDTYSHTLHIYCRVSTEIQVETGHSLLAQQNAGIAKAKSLGLKYQLHIEKAKSGASDDIEFKNRPVLKSLLDLCDDGKVTDVFITEQDRLSRSPLATFYIKRILIENKIKLHTISQTIQLEDPEQSFVSDLTSLLAKRERDLFIKRSKRGVIEGARKGKWPGAMLPYGYRRNKERVLEIDPEEAEIYLKMVEMSLKGIGTNTIAKHLNELEIETRAKKVLFKGTKVINKHTGTVRAVHNDEFIWRAGTIYCILTNRIYKGERVFKDEIIPVSAIIDVITWEKIQTNLKNNKNSSCTRGKHNYLLKGLLRCSCGCNLYGKIKKDERIYMCSSKRQKSCGLRSVNLDSLENIIWDYLVNNKFQINRIKEELKLINPADRLKSLNKKKVGIEKSISATIDRREKLIIYLETDKITLEEFDKRSSVLKLEKTNFEESLKFINIEIDNYTITLKSFESSITDSKILETINAWSFDEKKDFANRKINNITVYWDKTNWVHILEVIIDIAGFHSVNYLSINGSNKPTNVERKKLTTFDLQYLINKFPLQIPHHFIPANLDRRQSKA